MAKSLKERLKQDMALLLVILLFAGGGLVYLASSPLFAPAAAFFIIFFFGPYALELAKGKREKKASGKKMVIRAVNPDGKGMRVTTEWR
ncbi:MAG: hypothetical protein AB1324_00725 [Candidatus Micrarchaeota archaeon]